MQTFLGHPAFWRGMSMFAGMRWGKSGSDADPGIDGNATGGGKLVSWSSSVPSRRADELARSRQSDSDPAEE
ncbi:MAG: hypothetical protein ACYCZD_15365 [Rhodanobacter sp.]